MVEDDTMTDVTWRLFPSQSRVVLGVTGEGKRGKKGMGKGEEMVK